MPWASLFIGMLPCLRPVAKLTSWGWLLGEAVTSTGVFYQQ
jgi:hypothetical protein